MTRKLLIVDDEPQLRLLLEQTLESLADEGVEVLTAASGDEALELIRRERPALVLLDLSMPRLDGVEVCRRVRADAALASIRIAILVAHGQEVDRAALAAAGADRCLAKPFDPDRMLAETRRLLGLSR